MNRYPVRQRIIKSVGVKLFKPVTPRGVEINRALELGLSRVGRS